MSRKKKVQQVKIGLCLRCFWHLPNCGANKERCINPESRVKNLSEIDYPPVCSGFKSNSDADDGNCDKDFICLPSGQWIR